MKDKDKKILDEDLDNKASASLDELMMEADDDNGQDLKDEESVDFNSFMAEYRDLMHRSIGNSALEEKESESDGQERYLKEEKIDKKKKSDSSSNKKAIKSSDSEWNDDITLLPEEYEDLDDGSGMEKELPPEAPTPNFDLGEIREDSDEKFQLSINFEGEQPPADKDEEEKERKYDPDNPRAIDWVFDIVEIFVFVLATVIILTSFVFKHSEVWGDSMMQTLHDGDHLIISNLFYTPKRGDIIVFEDYTTSLKKSVVKRIIGLPGDTVEVKKAENGDYEVYINGEYLEEDYAYNVVNPHNNAVGIWEVQEGEVFVIGDNRYNSTDSRFAGVGPIDIDSILGKVLFRFFPFDKFGTLD